MPKQATEYHALKEDFQKVCKRILKSKLTTNRAKHVEYLHDLIESYNAAIRFIQKEYRNYNNELKRVAIEEIEYFRGKVVKCFEKLNIKESFSQDSYFNILNLELVWKYFSIAEIQSAFLERTKTSSLWRPGSVINPLKNPLENQNTTMTMTPVDFLALASRTINTPYDGNPLTLSAFINSIEILKEVVPDTLSAMFVRFIKSKLSGKALDIVPDATNSVNGIIGILKQKIKPDNSKVIAGRLLALRAEKANMTEFTDQAEKLADALQRSLIIEGISHEKAKEMTIEKTVELCRNATRSDLVKSILAASKFDSSKEVVAKYVVEANTEAREKQILQFKASNNKGGFNRDRGGYKNQKRGNYNNGYNNNNRNFNNPNYRGGRGKYRGRGRGRGGYANNYQRNRPQQYVRYAENYPGPSQDGRADQTQQPAQEIYIPFQQN